MVLLSSREPSLLVLYRPVYGTDVFDFKEVHTKYGVA